MRCTSMQLLYGMWMNEDERDYSMGLMKCFALVGMPDD